MEYEVGAGEHIENACKGALALAVKNGTTVGFTFNDTKVIAHPGESWQAVIAPRAGARIETLAGMQITAEKEN